MLFIHFYKCLEVNEGGITVENAQLKQLETVRKLMIQTGIEYGLANEKTVQLSHEFDRLMNDYQWYEECNTTHTAKKV